MLGRIYPHMPQQPLHLLNRHAFVYRHSRQGTPELMRMYALNIYRPSQDFQPPFYTARDLTM